MVTTFVIFVVKTVGKDFQILKPTLKPIWKEFHFLVLSVENSSGLDIHYITINHVYTILINIVCRSRNAQNIHITRNFRNGC